MKKGILILLVGLLCCAVGCSKDELVNDTVRANGGSKGKTLSVNSSLALNDGPSLLTNASDSNDLTDLLNIDDAFAAPPGTSAITCPEYVFWVKEIDKDSPNTPGFQFTLGLGSAIEFPCSASTDPCESGELKKSEVVLWAYASTNWIEINSWNFTAQEIIDLESVVDLATFTYNTGFQYYIEVKLNWEDENGVQAAPCPTDFVYFSPWSGFTGGMWEDEFIAENTSTENSTNLTAGSGSSSSASLGGPGGEVAYIKP